jgi:hypothetical protein
MSNSISNSPDKYASVIANDISRFRLVELSKVPVPAGIKRAQSDHGPFVVLQQGSMPGDLHGKALDFLLTKQRAWLPLFAFQQLPAQERDYLCVFNTAAEAMQLLEKLAGPAIVDAERVARALHVKSSSNPLDRGSQSSTPQKEN